MARAEVGHFTGFAERASAVGRTKHVDMFRGFGVVSNDHRAVFRDTDGRMNVTAHPFRRLHAVGDALHEERFVVGRDEKRCRGE